MIQIYLFHKGSIELAALALGTMVSDKQFNRCVYLFVNIRINLFYLFIYLFQFASVTGTSIFYGAISALDTLCPQGYTSGNPKIVGVYLQRSIIIILLGFIPIALIWWNSGIILICLGQDEELSAYA